MLRMNGITTQSPTLPPNGRTDTSLLERVREGDQRAFEQIYYRWHKPVYGFMLKTTRSTEDAEDIAQEVFIRLWKMREKIEPGGNIQALIFVIARRVAVDLYRRAGRMNAVFATEEQTADLSSAADLSPEELLEAHETKLLLQIAIESMPAKQREVFSLHYYENLSPAEIASRLGLSYENVRKQIWNGKRQLREVISLMVVFLLGQA
uniref:Putative RNA polymerase sigma factor n=2 Tax=termite gut metagenome TaxID=433724 RepID=S0DGJ4_9ZZZZ